MRDLVSNKSAANGAPKCAVVAINALGLDLHRQMPKEGNVCLSPYSIQSALAMLYLGASGVTQEEMERVLYFPTDKKALGASFAALEKVLDEAQKDSERMVEEAKQFFELIAEEAREEESGEAIILRVASRLFGQEGYAFRPAFLMEVAQYFGAPLQPMNFRKDPAGAARDINTWAANQTQDKIRDLIPQRTLSDETRIVLANAVYFKAAWADDFQVDATAPEPFHVNGGSQTTDVLTMRKTHRLSYFKGPGFQAVTLPYLGWRLHFLLLVPDCIDGLSEVESNLTPELLYECSRARNQEVILHLPKFKIAPPAADLSEMLRMLGMNSPFDSPLGSADFDAMAPKRPEEYLFISHVLHKTFIEIDEKGTEAAAATAIIAAGGCAAVERPKPVTLKADRPFLFAIQHTVSGACLFLGRVNDPR